MAQDTALFVANRGFCLATDCPLIFDHLLQHGWRIVIATRDDHWARGLEEKGVLFERVDFHRGGFAARCDATALRRLLQIHRRYKPVLVQQFNSKPVIIGNLAASVINRTHVVNTITGLGHAFVKGGYVRYLAIAGYRLLAARSSANIFLNRDDMRLFNSRGWIPAEKSELIVSPGVDCNKYRPRTQNTSDTVTVLMATRLLWQKGVREYIDAARQVMAENPRVKLQLAGEWDPVHPDAVDRRYVEEAAMRGDIEFLGYISNMREKLQEVDVFVLPSYREGVPRVLLEAMATGVPIITTDAPGCREAVKPGETGMLVPVGDSNSLAEAILSMAGDTTMRHAMGVEARKWCVEKFDIGVINKAMVEVYRKVGVCLPPLNPRPVLDDDGEVDASNAS